MCQIRLRETENAHFIPLDSLDQAQLRCVPECSAYDGFTDEQSPVAFGSTADQEIIRL